MMSITQQEFSKCQLLLQLITWGIFQTCGSHCYHNKNFSQWQPFLLKEFWEKMFQLRDTYIRLMQTPLSLLPFMSYKGWRNGSVVTRCTCRVPKFCFQLPHGDSKLFATPVLGLWFCFLWTLSIHVLHIHACKQNKYRHKMKINNSLINDSHGLT